MKDTNSFPRLLVISNSCLSETNSNGRTLRNFLIGWDPEKIAQFYIKSELPDFSVCKKYYCVTDNEALRAFLKGARVGKEIIEQENADTSSPPSDGKKKSKRNAMTMLARDIVWNSGKWKKGGFSAWVEAFAPQIVLLQAGDSAFMLKLARKISQKYNAPLVIYNSEVYYFKDFDYFKARGFAHLMCPFFRRRLRKQYQKAIKHAKLSIYACEMIQNEYDRVFSMPSETIYTASELSPPPEIQKNEAFTVSYLGNLGVGRHETLIDIANALQELSPQYHLDVYGKIPNELVKDAFDACPGIRYQGFIAYEDVTKVIQKSHLVVHSENFSSFYKKDLQYAFSTKIADSLASGTAFLLYAPEEMACSVYLRENKVAHVVNRKEDLLDTLRAIASSEQERNKYIERALALVKQNHSAAKNAERFQALLIDVAKENTDA